MTNVLSGPPAAAAYRPAAMPFAPVAADLAAVERVLTDTLSAYRGPVGPLVDHLKHYRGKRLRPALMLLAAEASGTITPAHHTLAAAVEMIHTATLVHDDVLDDAETRRHVSTVNAGWGNKTSILFGDMLFTHAFFLTSTIDGRACRVIGEATNRVCAGELRQTCERGNLHLTEADYFAIIDGKTAALTECAARLGAAYAGATDAVTESLAAYGRYLGMAFQVADDLLDLLGDEATTGKTLGTDLAQQKLTLPLIHCLNTLPAADADDLRHALRAGDTAAAVVALHRTQSLAYARRKAEDLVRKARKALECLPPSECRAILEQMTEWCLRRES